MHLEPRKHLCAHFLGRSLVRKKAAHLADSLLKLRQGLAHARVIARLAFHQPHLLRREGAQRMQGEHFLLVIGHETPPFSMSRRRRSPRRMFVFTVPSGSSNISASW